MSTQRSYEATISILDNESNSLKTLAYMSGFDPFDFYRSADLSGLDLHGQDLTGLNFEAADLRGCNLNNVGYDQGAFNGSKLSNKDLSIRDDFDCYIIDALPEECQFLYLSAKIRLGLVDKIVRHFGITYRRLCSLAEISEATLRKARLSATVSLDTIRRIAIAFQGKDIQEMLSFAAVSDIRQPAVQVFAVYPNGGLHPISRPEFLQMIDKGREIRRAQIKLGRLYDWRMGPDMLDYMYSSYVEGRSSTPVIPPWLEGGNQHNS